MDHFDHIVVGTGQATGTLLSGISRNESVAVLEGAEVGGTCVNVGCTPTKTLVASAKAAFAARRAAEYGVMTGGVSVDFPKVMARMNALRRSNRDGLAHYVESLENVTLIRDWATFTGPKTLRAGDKALSGEHVHINVGGRARVPDISGVNEVPWLDNRRILDLSELPGHLLIVGASYIGLEFAQIFRRLGSDVTVLGHGPRIMTREDEDVSLAAQRILEAEAISFILNADVKRLSRADAGVTLTYTADGQEQTLKGSHVLLATGRVPNTENLGLEAAGIETDRRGFINVDDQCRTNVPGVYALGDVNGRGAFTHTSVNDAEIVLDALYGGRHGSPRRLSERTTVYAMFIDPPLGRVGLTEQQALAQGYKLLKATREMKHISRAKEMGETQGFVKLLVNAEDDQILGASILGVNGDEIINMFAALMTSGLPCLTYRKTVLVHPTVGELMPWILDNLQPVN